ncbi:DEAD/DEAH box helicase [Bifidobacterium choloepi]|uniref:DEAD/DEAH box helicase n=1 Tax=Bifidobacterium choloepi TaxID=2614131 RepID=A0A6I5NIE9_9BIFI|nr:DEAD/DEAH box helicase [Bifidobacterium choloepi]NEG70143.1 DEAD/DEAH box helicase [Bifidobacterium choloepi]
MFEWMDGFMQATRDWFARRFGSATEAQRLAWPAIRSGKHVLVIAPTGSGKTLAAFLSAIDRLIREKTPSGDGESAQARGAARAKRRKKGVKVLYVSPLKALGVDVAKNLETPLDGIRHEIEQTEGKDAVPDIAVAMRSGDTTPKERAAIVRNPPDILVTTPESLYLMLTSKARSTLSTVETVILDEVHAVAGTKRGAHLALSLERLDDLLETPAQRIGLSATVNPVGEAARFLGGDRPVEIVHAAAPAAMDLKVVDPADRLPDSGRRKAPNDSPGIGTSEISGVTPAMRRLAERKDRKYLQADTEHDSLSAVRSDDGDGKPASVWPDIQRSVLDEVMKHRTTLVFVNSRGLAERLTAQLNDLYAARRHPREEKGAASLDDVYDRVLMGDAEGTRGLGKQTSSSGTIDQSDGPDEPRHRRSSYGSTSMLVGGPASLDPDDVIAMAHHGSVSKDRRKQIEDQLKRGQLRCVVATSSLELGIDMGSVDLVIQIAPPLSVSSGLQRVGRADHQVGGVSHALVYPLTRQQVIGAGTSVECMMDGAIEPLHMPANALDVLAQQTVAAAAIEPVNVDRWYATVRRSAPYANLPRDVYDSVIGMLTGAYASEDFSAFRPPLMIEKETGMLSGRPGAQRLAVTSGGTIPDRGMYTVVLPEGDGGGSKGPRRVGELDEEMVYESRVGDIITLGTSSWQIQEITRDRVIVTPAPGRSARLPFWHGDGDGRDYRFGLAQGQFVAAVGAGLTTTGSPATSGHGGRGQDANESYLTPERPTFTPAVLTRLRGDGLDDNAIRNLAAFLADQQRSTGVIPDATHLVVERTRDEEGDWTIVLHSPFGRRVHEPWALAINARMRQRYGFEPQIFAADDGIVMKVPDGDGTIDVAGLVKFDLDDLQRTVQEQVGDSVLYSARFREIAARSLYMPRMNPGKRVPLWQQRLRAAQLLAAARTQKNFPLLLETTRECLQDVYDVPALREVMERLNAGTIAVTDVVTETPSPMAEQLLFGFVGSVMYQYDVPQAERNSQLLSMDPGMLEKLLGTADYVTVLDEQAIDAVARQLAERTFWNELAADDIAGRVARYAKTHGPFTVAGLLEDETAAGTPIDAEQVVRALDRMKESGTVLTGRFDGRLPEGVDQWVHEDVFKRIRTKSLAAARAAVKPVKPDAYQRFLLELQGVGPVGAEQRDGLDGLMAVIEQLEGVALPVDVWERAVFPARVRDYMPMMLDELVMSSDVVWVGESDAKTSPRQGATVSFYPADSPQLAARRKIAIANAVDGGLTIEQVIVDQLAGGGAYQASQLEPVVKSTWLASAEPLIDEKTGEIVPPYWSGAAFEEALWNLVWQGSVTNSSFAVVRGRGAAQSGAARTGARTVRGGMTGRRRMRAAVPLRQPATAGGFWSLIPAAPAGDAGSGNDGNDDNDGNTADFTPEQVAIDEVELLLDRYGVVAQPIVEQAGIAGGFSAVYPVLRRMEERGLVVRGMFVDGFGAAQFAAKDTVDALRAVAATAGHAATGGSQSRFGSAAVSAGVTTVTLSTVDPAVVWGGAVRWPDAVSESAAKPMRKAGSFVVLRHGEPVLVANVKGKKLVAFTDVDSLLNQAAGELAYMLQRNAGAGPVTFSEANGEAIGVASPLYHPLRAAGFTPTPQGMKLYR